MLDVASRMEGRIQLTTDALSRTATPTTLAFDGDIDYAQLIKVYAGMPHRRPRFQVQPAECIGTKVDVRHGNPDSTHVSTSYVERAEPYDAHGHARFTRAHQRFSKKIENHEHAIALPLMHYNFCRKHEFAEDDAGHAAGVASHAWTWRLVALLPTKPAGPGAR